MKSVRKGNRILLVDDETDITTALKIALEDAGFIVHTYNDPLIALSEFKPDYYDLAILDVKMQEMNGLELYTNMRKVDNQVRFCFITAGELYYDKVRKEKQEEEKEEPYCKLNTERFLQKPISNVELLETIDKVMMQR
jgi:DNA-binding response OmpR family regulator